MNFEFYNIFAYLSQSYMAYGEHKRKYSSVIGDEIHEFTTLHI